MPAVSRPHDSSSDQLRPRLLEAQEAPPGFSTRTSVPLPRQTMRTLARRPLSMWICAISVAAATLIIQGYRVRAAPDVFADEGQYLLVGRHLASGAGLTGGNGLFLVHPPLYFLIEAGFIKLLGLGNAAPLPLLFSVRWINICFSAATAAVLVWFGYKLRGLLMGLLIGLLFLLDPYVERINRRSMLETVTIFFVVVGVAVFGTLEPKRRAWRWAGGGLALGLAIVTKEAAAVFLLVPFVFTLFDKRRHTREAVYAAIVAASVYLTYVAWLVIDHHGGAYWDYKRYQLQRIAHALFGSHLGAPPGGGPSGAFTKALSTENLSTLVQQYASSYLLIGLALIGVIVLIFRFRDDRNARLLAIWMIVTVTWCAVLVRVSDQYFYFVIVPAIMVDGYLYEALFTRGRLPSAAQRLATPMVVVLLTACGVFGAYGWFVHYATGSDNCVTQLAGYIRSRVPARSTIVSTDDVMGFLLPSSYLVQVERDLPLSIAKRQRYFLVSSKDQWSTGASPGYNWVVRKARPLVVCHDTSYWNLGLYRRTAKATAL